MTEHGTEAFVLGCTGMIDVATMIQKDLKCPVVKPSFADITILESMVRYGSSHAQGWKYTQVALF